MTPMDERMFLGIVRSYAIDLVLAVLTDGRSGSAGRRSENSGGADFWMEVSNKDQHTRVTDILADLIEVLNCLQTNAEIPGCLLEFIQLRFQHHLH